MTQISYLKNDRQLTVRVKGHAGYDIEGKDIVCSAISTLVQSLMGVCEVYQEQNLCNIVLKRVNTKAGNVDFQVTYKEAENDRFTAIFDMFLTGCYGVSNAYPKNVCIKH